MLSRCRCCEAKKLSHAQLCYYFQIFNHLKLNFIVKYDIGIYSLSRLWIALDLFSVALLALQYSEENRSPAALVVTAFLCVFLCFAARGLHVGCVALRLEPCSETIIVRLMIQIITMLIIVQYLQIF